MMISKITECKSICTEILFPSDPEPETGYIIYSDEPATAAEPAPAPEDAEATPAA